MSLSNLDAILSTVGWGLIIFSFLLWAMVGCTKSDNKGGGMFRSLAWLCAVACWILQIVAIWIY